MNPISWWPMIVSVSDSETVCWMTFGAMFHHAFDIFHLRVFPRFSHAAVYVSIPSAAEPVAKRSEAVFA